MDINLDIKGSSGEVLTVKVCVEQEVLIWYFSGDLVYGTVTEKFSELRKLRSVKLSGNQNKKSKEKGNIWSIDCRRIKHLDSCGVAFLLSCVRYAKDNKLKLQLIDLPESIYPLLQVQGIDDLLLPLVRDVL